MWRLRRRPRNGPLPFKYVFVISSVIFIVLTFLGLVYVNKGIAPIIMSIADTKSRQIATRAINDAISKKIVEGMDVDEMIIELDGGAYGFNYKVVDRIVSESTVRVQKYLFAVESGEIDQFDTDFNDIDIEYERVGETDGIIFDIPLGTATKNVLFENLGPRIPVKFEIIGSVESQARTEKVTMGINNTFLEVYIDFKVIANVVIPFSSDDVVITNSVKIGDLFIPGPVPDFYTPSGSGIQPVVPIEKKDEKKQEKKDSTQKNGH